MLPLVSIIIPTFNRAHLIGETLHSISAQTYQNWECIVVDDGSTDDTENVLRDYIQKDERFKYLKRPEHRKRGGNAARNFGFENSKGDYINFVDSDDLIHPDKLKLQLAVLEDDETCQVCLSEAELFSGSQRRKKKSKPLEGIDFFEDYILRNIDMGTLQPLWRKEFLASADVVYDEKLKKAQDYDFFSRMSFRPDFLHCTVNSVLVFVRAEGKGRIKDLQNNPEGITSHLQAYYKTNLLVQERNDEALYKKHINVFLRKMLPYINAKDCDIALGFLKKMKDSAYKDDPKYKKHFRRILIMVTLLKYSGFRGYSIFKRYYFLK